jgi:hypothetical protein
MEWCLHYFSDLSFSNELPFTEVGNAHLLDSTSLVIQSEKMFREALQSNKKFIRLHPGSTNTTAIKLYRTASKPLECYRIELELLQNVSDNVIVIYFDLNNILWGINNIVKAFVEKTNEVVEFFQENNVDIKDSVYSKSLIEWLLIELKDSTKDNVKNWGKDSIEDLEVWELREFLSLYLHGAWNDLYGNFDILQKEFPNCIFISIDQLRDNFATTIKNLLKRLNLPMVRHNVNFVFQEWQKRQFFINKDIEIFNIVQSVLKGEDVDWPPLSIVDEAEIQKQLRDNGKDVKCYNLNEFPRNSKVLNKLLINV